VKAPVDNGRKPADGTELGNIAVVTVVDGVLTVLVASNNVGNTALPMLDDVCKISAGVSDETVTVVKELAVDCNGNEQVVDTGVIFAD